MTIKGMRRATALVWTTRTEVNMRAAIDNAIGIGLNALTIFITPTDINKIKNGSDHYNAALNYAHQNNVQLIFLLTIDEYVDRNIFPTDINAQNRFISDLSYVLQHHPTLDGIELEEACTYSLDYTYENVARFNIFYTRCKTEVTTHAKSGFNFGINLPSNHAPNNLLQGFDADYVNKNRLFTYYSAQLATNNFNTYTSSYNSWKNRLPNLEIIINTYVTYSGLTNQCPNGWNEPKCWNQAFFKEIEWSYNSNIPLSVFTLERLATSSYYWPDETIVGATGGDKLITIFETSVVPPPAENLIQNPNFDNGFTSWQTFTNGAVNFSIDTALGAAKIDVTNVGTNTQLHQTGVTLEPDTEYTLEFDIFGAKNTQLSTSVFQNVSPYTNYGLRAIVDVTTNWKRVALPFITTNNTQVSDARLMFLFSPLANPGDIYYIDNVYLAKVIEVPPNLCEGVDCDDICDGLDLWSQRCDLNTGNCVLYQLIESNSTTCGFDPCADVVCENICDGVNLWSQRCDPATGNCVLYQLIEANSIACGFDPCEGVVCPTVCIGDDLWSQRCDPDTGDCVLYQLLQPDSINCKIPDQVPSDESTIQTYILLGGLGLMGLAILLLKK